ncbi:MAG TPA: sugar O-acetyltransferase [Gaiellaceae bacterium]
MTARERMVAGELYDALDPELVEARERARLLLARYNATGDREALTALFGRLADDAVVEAPFHCDYGFNISVGRRFYTNVNCVFLDCAPIEIGDHVLLGPGVHLYTATHPPDSGERRSGLELAKPISVGDDAWLGGGAIVLPGVMIGARAVVGAGSVVTRDVSADERVAGNPARPIGR